MSLQQLIDEMEQHLDRAMRIPASNKLVVDEGVLRDLIDAIRQNTLDDDTAGQRLTAERDRIIHEARLQARRIIDDAQHHIHAKLEGEGSVQAARERARQIIADAEQQANRVKAEGDAYVVSQLNGLETRLQRLLHEVQAGQRYLTQQAPEPKNASETGR